MAERYRLVRVVIPALGLAVLLAGMLWTGREEPVVDVTTVAGQVMAVERGQAETLRGSTATLVTLRIALPEGVEVRVPVFGVVPRPGDAVLLEERRFADGTRQWRLSPEPAAAPTRL